jgi:hypothetical protein
MGPGAIQQDNARPHRARVVNDFLQQQQVAGIDWPARSPDLNPIEHLWDALGRLIRGNHPPAANLGGLFQLLQQEWQAIPQHTPRELVNSMRQCCLDCTSTNGSHTQY